jgi:hypothetical protein
VSIVKGSPAPLEAVRLALAELGDAPHQELAAFVYERFRVRIPPQFIPIAKASLQGLEHLQAARRAAKELVAQAQAEPKPKRRRAAGGVTQGTPPAAA